MDSHRLWVAVIIVWVGVSLSLPDVARREFFPTTLVRAEEQSLLLDLRGAIDRALAQRPVVKAAVARVAATTLAEDVARTQYRPYLVLDTRVAHLVQGTRDILTGEEAATLSRGTKDFYAASLTLGIPVVREGNVVIATLPSERHATAERRAAEFVQQQMQQNVILEVSLTFFETLLHTEQMQVMESQVRAREQLYAVVQKRSQLGLVAPTDLLSAKAALAKSQADLTETRNNLAAALTVLATRIGLQPTTQIRLVESALAPSPLPPLGELLKITTQQNLHVATQQAHFGRALAALQREQSGRYPEVTFFTRYQVIDNFDLPLNSEELGVFLRLNWRFFDFGATTARISQRTQEVAVAMAELDVVKDSVAEEMVQRYTQVLNAEARIPPAQTQVEYAQEMLRLSQERFRQNLAPQSEVLDRQAQSTEAQKNLVGLRYDLQVSYARVRRLLSGN